MTKEQMIEKFNRIIEKLRQSKEHKRQSANSRHISDIRLFEGSSDYVSVEYNKVDVTRAYVGNFFAEVKVNNCFDEPSHVVSVEDWLVEVEKKVDAILLEDARPAEIVVDGVRYVKAGDK